MPRLSGTIHLDHFRIYQAAQEPDPNAVKEFGPSGGLVTRGDICLTPVGLYVATKTDNLQQVEWTPVDPLTVAALQQPNPDETLIRTHTVTADAVPITEHTPGLNSHTVGLIHDAGYTTEEDIRIATDQALLAIKGIGPKTVADLRNHIGSGPERSH